MSTKKNKCGRKDLQKNNSFIPLNYVSDGHIIVTYRQRCKAYGNYDWLIMESQLPNHNEHTKNNVFANSYDTSTISEASTGCPSSTANKPPAPHFLRHPFGLKNNPPDR